MAEKPGYLKGGWKQKYVIAKKDGSPVDDGACYFVLRLDEDPCAREAIETYARAVAKAGNKHFAADIRRMLRHTEEAFQLSVARQG